MANISFAIALHFHQPIGNFEHIFERAFRFCYQPFLQLLAKYPKIKMTLHFSGCLLDYLKKKHPEIIETIAALRAGNQIEIMTGTYYEAILPGIPQEDAAVQIKMMSDYIQHKFKFIPQGMWLPERVWHPDFTGFLYQQGVRYLILDDEHLLRSGVKPENMHGYFLTGEGKAKLAVFPSHKQLRYSIPFKPVEQTIEYFRSVAGTRGDILFTYGDDGEKFGEWPGTHDWVFNRHWLRNFFELLQQNSDWIELVHFSGYLSQHSPVACLKIAPGSYEEMMQWSAGSWLNFLNKYPEANQMHKKMLYVSSELSSLEKKIGPAEKRNLQEAKLELYQGQCNCAYWHGVFGGLYLFHLRKAVYAHLIAAEKLADWLLHKGSKKWLEIQQCDFNRDGQNELVIKNNDFSIYIDPQEGATIKELDYRPACFNLVNTIARRKETYHQQILDKIQSVNQETSATIHDDFRAVDSALKKELVYDKFGRYCLRSYFLSNQPKLEELINCSYQEAGDFSTGNYQLKISKSKENALLERQARIGERQISLSKQIEIKSRNEIAILSQVCGDASKAPSLVLALEFNLTMPDLNADRYHYFFSGKKQQGLNSQGEIAYICDFMLKDSLQQFNISLNFSQKAQRIFYFPVRTVSQSERAYELNYQCSCILGLWNLKFCKSERFDLSINLTLG